MSGDLDGIELREGIDFARIDELLAFYEREWWTQGRERADVERMLVGSDAVVAAVELDSGELVGFVRALSDGAFRSTIFDLIVARAWQGRGLGRALVERILATPALERCRRTDLVCREDMAAFYESLGFERSASDQIRMEWTRG